MDEVKCNYLNSHTTLLFHLSLFIMRNQRFLFTVAILSVLLIACTTSKKAIAVDASTAAPAYSADREFRAAWVATVANINWPSKPGLPVDSQQKEAIHLLDFLDQHHFNAVILQVRPQADSAAAMTQARYTGSTMKPRLKTPFRLSGTG